MGGHASLFKASSTVSSATRCEHPLIDPQQQQQQQQLVAGPQLEWVAIIALFSVAEKVSWP